VKARLRLVLVVVLLVGVVAAWVVVPASDAFRIRHLEVTGASAVGDLEVRERIDSLLTGETVYTVDEDKVAARIEELPFVRSVRVERHLPGGLQLHVLEYRPLALGYGDGGYWLVARNGRVLAKARPKEWSGRIPAVTLRDGDIKPGDHVDDEPALRLLSSRPASSTLEFATIKADEYAITAELVDGTEVRFGRPIALRQKLLVAEKMLQEAARKDLEPRYIDVTVPGKPAFCAKSVVACGMRRGPAPTDAKTKPGTTAGAAAASDATTEETDTAPITNGADQLAADDA
jgi:cell division protein FtsQ